MTLAALRIVGTGLALCLMLGEVWRSWGVGRPLVFVLDDFVFGIPLLVGAVTARYARPRTVTLLAVGYAGCAGMLYGSFFTKVVEPETTVAGNWNADVLTVLIGLAFVVSVVGAIATLAVRTHTDSGSLPPLP